MTRRLAITVACALLAAGLACWLAAARRQAPERGGLTAAAPTGPADTIRPGVMPKATAVRTAAAALPVRMPHPGQAFASARAPVSRSDADEAPWGSEVERVRTARGGERGARPPAGGPPAETDATLESLWAAPYGTAAYWHGIRSLAAGRHPGLAGELATALGAADDGDRDRIMDMLHALRGPDVIMAIVSALDDAFDPDHRMALLEILRDRQSAGEGARLSGAMHGGAADVAAAAAWGLANVGGADACMRLADAAEAPGASPALATALAIGRHPFSQTALLALASDIARTPAVRESALHALAEPRSERVRVVLSNALREEPVPRVAALMRDTVDAMASDARARETGAGVDLATGAERWF